VTTRTLASRVSTLILSACLLVLLGSAVTAQSASPGPSISPEPSADSTPAPHPLSGSWDVMSFDAWGEGLAQPRAGASWTAVFLTDGRLEGSTGCGTYYGGYTMDGERLGMGIISKGPDPCDVQTTEEAVEYSVALESVISWRPVTEGVELLDEAGAVRVLLTRTGDVGVAGDWAVTRYARANGKPAEPLADRPILLTFAEDGSVRGSSGCRLLDGLYSSQADQVVIAPVETTGLPCEGDVRSQERRLLRIFEQVVFWQRQGERLVLADASGAPLLELVAVEEPMEAVPSGLPAETGG
jgi:heat shock protein HslJ